jgi:predicted transcriptional regulator YdeE
LTILARSFNPSRYDERFDGRTGNGEVEIWIPVRR